MNNKTYLELSKLDNKELFELYKTKEKGLSSEEVNIRLEEYGKNIPNNTKEKSIFYFMINSFKDKFIFILFILAFVNFITGDKLGSIIIIGISIVSALIRFIQDYSTYKFNKKLKEEIRIFTDVIRNSKQKEIRQENVVVGDIIALSAGSVVPADLFLFDSKDLFINQSIFTGESVAVEKKDIINTNEEDVLSMPNICLMGCNIISGSGLGIVIKTGMDTFIGQMSSKNDSNKKEFKTPFEEGMSKITTLLIKYMVVISILVFIIYGFIRHDIKEALLFALSIAVGITPSMLPMIVNVNLTKGSKSLAKKKTLVKNIESIQNLGSMDILCTDKTGTLTENKIVLQKYINLHGEDDEYVLKCAYVNSKLSTCYKNTIDKAIISYGKEKKIDISNYIKIDEIPFDYTRKRMSMVVQKGSGYRVITKGAFDEVIKVCDMALIDNKEVEINDDIINDVRNKEKELASQGMQVIALAIKSEYKGVDIFNVEDEKELTLIGLIAFLDPPKRDAKITIDELERLGIKTKILTGDNIYSTRSICNLVGINSELLTGNDIEKLSDEELSKVVEKVDVYAKLNPLQKERIVRILKNNGHSVGYMGDGVNDALALQISDVGISVDTGTDIAKESSDMILLEQNLTVVHDGVIEGRKVYGNIIKYMKLALSQDFGDVFSIMISSICLPFLPLLPIQMLIQDFIVEISQIGIPYDNVDEEFLLKPKKWDTKDLSKFMKIFGIISSITDVLAFIIFWFIFKYNSVDKQSYFQTAWFIECLMSETFIIYYLRTNKLQIYKSNPSKILVSLTLITMSVTILIPIILNNIPGFNFVILPLYYYLYVLGLGILYMIIVKIVKKIYITKYNEWL